MKKIIMRVLIGTGIVVLLIVLSFIAYSVKAKSEVKVMTPAETKQITDNVFSLKDSFVNLFLVKDSDTYVAIDAGNNPDAVSSEMKKLNINPARVIAILLTHTDGDHVAAIKLFKNGKVYLSRQEAGLINGTKSRFLFFGNNIATKEYSTLEDQQIFNIGNIKIQGYLTPGHTPGSMSYLINDEYLFTGDLLSLRAGRIGGFNKFFNMDTETSLNAIQKITGIPVTRYIFTAHYGYCDDYRKAIEEWEKTHNQ
jgi:hydroxyacylglutathione hydrolase